MTPNLVTAEYVSKYTIHVRFKDGMEGDLNLEAELHGPIFEPLKNLSFFKQFFIHPEFRTLTWPNGADFAPEFVYEKVNIAA